MLFLVAGEISKGRKMVSVSSPHTLTLGDVASAVVVKLYHQGAWYLVISVSEFDTVNFWWCGQD